MRDRNPQSQQKARSSKGDLETISPTNALGIQILSATRNFKKFT